MKKHFTLIVVYVLLIIMGVHTSVHAEGSKDLYPSGIQGGRATLFSGNVGNIAFPFPTRGTHFVYAKVGETIALASSAQSATTTPRIRLYGPNGSLIVLNIPNNNAGRIPGRNAELAGPRLPNQGMGGSRYQAIYHTVQTEGIYRVEFAGTNGWNNENSSDGRAIELMANSTWTQDPNSNYIWAWDVSVANVDKTAWTSGRVYTNVLNMDNASFQNSTPFPFLPNGGFYGTFKVLTRDGYLYHVANNGMNGISFTFMVNNRGFHEIENPDIPIYKSILAPNSTSVTNRYSDPRALDVGATVTQKIFYNKPDKTMPEESIGAVPGGQTWLMNEEKILEVDSISVKGVEGNLNKLGSKGAYIKFFNESGGDYVISIKPVAPNSFPVRTIEGTSIIGDNEIYWDGKDGIGNSLPSGLSNIEISITLRGAEVHFPYIDMELNPNGIILELQNIDWNGVRSDVVYWNDTDIPNVTTGTNSSPKNAHHDNIPLGTSSNSNGHKWGANTNVTAGSFGDEKGMDTWTFIQGDAVTAIIEVDVRVADLKISDIFSDKNLVKAGEELNYTVKVKNDGPQDAEDSRFTFTLPEGFVDAGNITFDGDNCGSEVIGESLTYDASSRTYSSSLNLPNQCEITYVIKTRATISVESGNLNVEATILRPGDVTDPDATNPDINTLPTNAHDECYNNVPTNTMTDPVYPLGCNNVRVYEIQVNSLIAKDDINQTPINTPVDGDVLTNDKGEGLTVTQLGYYDDQGNLQSIGLNNIATTVTVYTKGSHPVKTGYIVINPDGTYTFTPETDYVGGVPLHYTVTDAKNMSDEANLDIEVLPTLSFEEHAPVAQNDVVYTKKNTLISNNALENDSDPKDETIKVTTYGQEGNINNPFGSSIIVSGKDDNGDPVSNAGTFTMDENGLYTFTPNSGFVGTVDPITYEIENEQGNKNTAKITIIVSPIQENNTFANDDANTAPKGETMNGNVLDNDFDPEDDPQTVTSIEVGSQEYPIDTNTPATVTIPGKGIIVVNEDGSYEWTPEPNFVGTVVVPYTTCDNGTPVACDNASLYLTNLEILSNISGTVHHDANGVTDNTIDGNGIGNTDNTPLNVVLVDENNEVVAVTSVNPDGTYEFTEIPTGDYTLVLTTENPAIGSSTPDADLPGDWVNVGEGTGTPVHDGNPDGKLSVTLTKEGLEDADFGIQQKPTADSKSFDHVENYMFSQDPMGSFPAVTGYRGIEASNAGLTGYPHGGSLSGTDPEDCPTTSACNTSTGTTFAIETIKSNTKLYYDFEGTTGVIEIDVTGGAVSIENFDVSKLAIYGEDGSGDENEALRFTYTIVDEAGVKSDPVAYTISTTHPLPIQLVSFDATKKGQVAVLDWITAAEENNSGFDIERSVDGINWNKIGFTVTQAENGNSSATLNYQFLDEQPMSGANFYRLKQVDFDGSFEYSIVRQLVFDRSKNAVIVYPNPAQDYVIVDGLNSKATIHVINAVGQEVLKQISESNTMKLQINQLPSGMYYIHVLQDGVEVQVEKVMITK